MVPSRRPPRKPGLLHDLVSMRVAKAEISVGFFGQHGIQTSSLVFDLERYKWSDDEWVEKRKGKQWHKERDRDGSILSD